MVRVGIQRGIRSPDVGICVTQVIVCEQQTFQSLTHMERKASVLDKSSAQGTLFPLFSLFISVMSSAQKFLHTGSFWYVKKVKLKVLRKSIIFSNLKTYVVMCSVKLQMDCYH